MLSCYGARIFFSLAHEMLRGKRYWEKKERKKCHNCCVEEIYALTNPTHNANTDSFVMTQHLTDKTTPPPLPFLIMALESETEETKILKYWEQAIEKKDKKCSLCLFFTRKIELENWNWIFSCSWWRLRSKWREHIWCNTGHNISENKCNIL